MPWKPKQNLSRSKLPKGFSTTKQTWVKLSVLSRSNHSRQQATLQHTLCFSRSGLSQRVSLTIQFKYCLKVTKTKEGFLSKLQTGFQSWRNSESDPLRIKSFHSVLKLLKCFQTVQIMFGFLQKHHNSQLQNETSATAVSVVLVECHKMLYEASIIQKRPKVYLLQMIFGQIKTTNYDLSIHNRSTSK